MIRAGAVIADRLGTVMPKKDRTRMVQSGEQRLGVRNREFEMLRSNAVGDRACLVEALYPQQRTAPRQRRANDVLAWHCRKLPRNARRNRIEELGVGRNQDCL